MISSSTMAVGILGGTSSSSSGSFYSPITISSTLLAANYSAKLAQTTAGTGTAASSASGSSSASSSQNKNNITAPWEEGRKASSVTAGYLAANKLNKFIDLNSSSVQNAKGNADYKELFALFNGMSSMRALAAYAAQDTIPSSVLGSINSKFQSALAEVRNFVSTYKSDKLNLLYGDKTDNEKSAAVISNAPTSYTGRVVQIGDQSAAIPGLTGTEKFTVTLKSGTTSQDFQIDLSKVSGPLNARNIADYVNQVIHAPQAVDSNGNPVFDKNGNPVQKFTSYFTVDTSKGDNLGALKIVPSLVEQVSSERARRHAVGICDRQQHPACRRPAIRLSDQAGRC